MSTGGAKLFQWFFFDFYKLGIDETIRLETMASNTGTSQTELLKAIIYAVYHSPHSYWDEVLKNYRERNV